MKRVGVVTTSFPVDADDMRGRFVFTHVQGRLLRGASQVHVVTVSAPRPRALEHEASGLQITRIPSVGLFDAEGAPEVWDRSRGIDKGRLLLEAARVTSALVNQVRRDAFNWDEVESHWLVPSAVAVALGAPSLPHTAFAHSGDVAWLESSAGGAALARWLVARVNEVVCVSQPLAERLHRLVRRWPPHTPLTVRPMPTDDKAFGNGEDVRRAFIVLGVGRLVPLKGFDDLVLAVGGLPRGHRPQVVLLGEGPERERLSRLAAAVRVDLRMPGVVPPADVARWMRRAAVCVVPSRVLRGGRQEGAPLVVREAIACGAPLVTTLSGVPGANRVPERDPAAIRRALGSLLRSGTYTAA